MTIQDSLNQFLMLMYKGFLLRKRHYIVTLIEIILPVLFASIPVMILSAIANSPMGPRLQPVSQHVNATTFKPFSPFKNPGSYIEKAVFIYTPKNIEPLFNQSLECWNRTLKLGIFERTRNIPFEIHAVDSESEMEDLALTISNSYDIIGTVFGKETMKSLDYKIRYRTMMSNPFHTNTQFQYRGLPNDESAYENTAFMSWQAAIEQTFIRNSAKRNTSFEVTMQRFPYPPYEKRDPGMPIFALLMFFVYGFVIFMYVLMKRVVEEKANRCKELLKMMGMTNCNYWTSTFCNHFVIALIDVFIVAILYTSPMPNGLSLMPNTNFFLLFCILLLFIANVILMAFVVTTFFNKVIVAVPVFMIVFVVPYSLLQSYYFPMGNLNSFIVLSRPSRMAICLIPAGALQVAFAILMTLTSAGQGATWSNLGSYIAIPDMNLAIVMFLMLVSCGIFCVLIWYIDAVWPWQYGVPKPLYFPFTKSYWCGESKKDFDLQELMTVGDAFFEPDPVGITPGIVIKNLTKDFKSGFTSKRAVDAVSLNVYSGQITALLGRNGAGKTTTVNMLTGLFTPDSGSATISGWDIGHHMNEARKCLGICPQDNILFPTLTVYDHLQIFAGMKGVKYGNMSAECDRILKLVNLTDKRNSPTQALSGGMKRKLGLAIAILGDSEVLFLDEPTSGLDPENRRNLWDILLEIRHNKTIVLTTHYMEEADILGDRIAIMVDGKIRCCGSSVFLKRQFGTGYHLNIGRDEDCNVSKITSLLLEFIPEAKLEQSSEKELKYSFGGSCSGSSFAKMFQALEENRQSLGIESFGMTVTTLDDVFLKVNMMDETNSKDPDCDIPVNGNLNVQEGELLIDAPIPETGLVLWLNRMKAFFYKRFCYSRRHYSILFTLFVLPIAMMCIFLAVVQLLFKWTDSQVPLPLDLEHIAGKTQAIYKPNIIAKKFLDDYYLPLLRQNDVGTIHTDSDITKYLIDFGSKDLLTYLRNFLVGVEVNMTETSINATAWYNGEPYNVLPVSMNLIHNSLLRYLSGDDTARMSVTNAPLPYISGFDFTRDDPSAILRPLTGVFIPLCLSYAAASYVRVPVTECVSRAKLLQLMSGVSTFTYWLGMFLWDMITHSLLTLILIIPFAIFQHTVFFTSSDAIGSVILLLLLFGWATLPTGYILSRVIQKPSTGNTILLSVNFVIGCILSTILSTLDAAFPFNTKILIAVFFLRLMPIFSVTWGFTKLVVGAFKNTRCVRIPAKVLKTYCSMKQVPSSIVPCCANLCKDNCFTTTPLLSFNETGCGRDALFLFLDGILYFGLLLFLETGLFEKAWERLSAHFPWRKSVNQVTGHVISEVDTDVLNERQRILTMDPRTVSHEALVANQLVKKYGNVTAVDKLSFAIHKQECFGLLGVNGAGKTSTFKMLAGDTFPTEGDAFIDGYSLRTDLKKFQSFIGYCPQFDALIDLLTGREMLTLFAYVRGVPSAFVDQTVNNLIHRIDLQDHADKKTELYSGGNKRKLSLGMALIGSPPLILLDEPTSGVDPVSRRKIWSILSHARQATQAAVVLCTHSMEECEALCSRLAIMVKGQFRCLGAIQHLKSKFGQGFTIIAKFANRDQVNETVLEAFKNQFYGAFPSGVLNEYHQGVLNFHIRDASIPWSILFSSMEQMKEMFQLEDYFISGTTLEQIFLAFAHEN